ELGGWSTKGCITIQPNEIDDVTSVVNCQCNHLTNFAVLFTIDGVTTAEKVDSGHELALTLISYIGCGISLACIMMTLLTLALFKPMRRHIPSKVLIGLCTSIGCLIIVFITLIDQTKPSWLCTATSTVLHFLILNCFCWMLVEALTLYLKVVKVMGEYTSKFILKSLFGTFGVPLFVVTVCLLADKNDYQDLEIGRQSTTRIATPNCRLSCCTLLGLTWIFGLLAVGETRLVFQYLFCIFNSLQGAFIFYFNILRQTRTVEAWRGFLAGKGRAYIFNFQWITLITQHQIQINKFEKLSTFK
ncbi:adhesion G-protein coupled receptor G2-like, partial [Clytia hemisphaerica]|uniref:adhesion G-protein coupled receptor G2-like n=1 Tax=Clytia hemisphaerica TaxID=252671 RepID=UPI0034D539B5